MLIVEQTEMELKNSLVEIGQNEGLTVARIKRKTPALKSALQSNQSFCVGSAKACTERRRRRTKLPADGRKMLENC